MKSKVRITKETYIWTNENDDGVFHYKDGKEHREDGPAVELKNGTRKWFINGKLHREDGPAAELDNGTKHWWFNGKLHRDDGPAVESADGGKEWWINGERHRDDGPACIYIDPDEGGFFYEWFRNGKRVTEQEIEQFIVKKALNEKLHTILEPRHKEKKKKI